MKRDMELIKAILLSLEQHDQIRTTSIPSYSPEQIGYHIGLLQDAGLITQEPYVNLDVSAATLFGTRMTWQGHEFLDASRNITIWERAKKITLEKTGALTFEVLKAVLIEIGKEAVGVGKSATIGP